MAKMQIIGDPIADMLEDMDRIGIDIKPAVNEALEETQKLIADNLKTDAQIYNKKGGGLKGYAQGNMYKTIVDDNKVNWTTPTDAWINSGFWLDEKGGFHSIFIMYGTPRHGKNNSGITKDTKVYNAIKGARTRTRIEGIQREVMKKYLKLGR